MCTNQRLKREGGREREGEKGGERRPGQSLLYGGGEGGVGSDE